MTAKIHLTNGTIRTYGIIAPDGAAPATLDGKGVSQGELTGSFRLRSTDDPTGQTFDYDADDE